ncbi:MULTISPECIES: ribosome maturation factor RimM [Acidipropionibacterium]|uniref:ribosome maturation factor RimM n=1 Tax=Acidipropionibacterium TaxID=1912215 RepID=UPI00040A4104|nr:MULTISPECIES: ribosome maturation factor RimM [Acidipropionibacterium]
MSEHLEVVVGRVGRAHGLRGDVLVSLRTDEPSRRFAPGSLVGIEGTGRKLHVTAGRDLSGGFQVHFAEVADRTAAEALKGAVLVAEVAADELPDGDDEYYDRQLRALTVLNSQGEQLGEVTDVIHLPAQDLLAIDVDGVERLVPFVSALVTGVDLAAGTLTLAEVGGLVDDQAEEAL